MNNAIYKISVVMPVYKVNRYIEKSVESVCNQEFRDFQLILVDDGTTDNSIELAESVLKRHCGTNYKIVHKENGGLPSARNAGIAVANSKYICFVDSDDIIDKSHLKVLYELNEKYKLNLSYGDFELTYQSKRCGNKCESYEQEIIQREELLKGFLTRKLKIHCCSILFNLEYLNNIGFKFNILLKYGEDIEFMWRLLPMQRAVGHIKAKTYKYLQRPNSIMTSQSIEKIVTLCDEFKKVSEENFQVYPEDCEIFRFLTGKGYLAFFRTAAETSALKTFIILLNYIEYKGEIRVMKKFPNKKIRMLAILLYLNPFIFYTVINFIKCFKFRNIKEIRTSIL